MPNLQYINPTFKNLWWDPTNEYQVPKDYGTTGILYMKSMLSKIPQSWREFYEMIEGEASGKVVFVESPGDVFVFPLKMLGYSLNSVDKDELDEARTILLEVAPRLVRARLEHLPDQHEGSRREHVSRLDRTTRSGAQAREGFRRGRLPRPVGGSLFWLDTWTMLADAPRERGVRVNFIHDAGGPGHRDELQRVCDAQRRGEEFVDPVILNDPRSSRPMTSSRSSRAARTPRATQRADIWEEFKQAVGG